MSGFDNYDTLIKRWNVEKDIYDNLRLYFLLRQQEERGVS